MKQFTKNKDNIKVICDLDIQRYLGNWFEIGRLPLRSERNLDNVTAIYNLKKNGKVEVINSGFKNGKKKQIRGIAWIPDKNCKGSLLVRFFWPFKSEYNVIKLEEEYRWAVVMGEDKSNLWILSRTPKMETDLYNQIISFLNENGFHTEKIIKTEQNKD